MEASLADELSMMDPFAASVRDGEPTTNGGGAAAADETVASSTEKERIKLAVPAAFSSDMQSSTHSRASAGAEVYEAAIEELESELAEVQEQLQVRGGMSSRLQGVSAQRWPAAPSLWPCTL